MSLSTQKKIIPYIFILPAFILFCVFMVFPLLKGFQISFYNWSVMPNTPSTFVGLDNYLRVFQDKNAGVAFKNTLLYVFVTVPGQIIFAMLISLMIHNVTKGKIFFRTIYYIPVVTSWVIVSLLFRYLFQSPQGVINYFLVDVLHITDKAVPFLQNATTAMIPILSLGIWKGLGWSIIIYLAALSTIPKEVIEASAIDGANSWQTFWSITLPLISPTVVFTLVMLLIGGFNVFISVYLITNGGPMQQTEVYLSYLYHQTFTYLDFGYGGALSFLLAFFIVTVSGLQLKFLRRPQELM